MYNAPEIKDESIKIFGGAIIMKKKFSAEIDWRIYFGSVGIFGGSCLFGFVFAAAVIGKLF